MATSDVDVDFHEIVKTYFRLMEEKRSKINNSQATTQASPQWQMMAPDFRNLRLTVAEEHIDWVDRSNVMAAEAFAKLTRDVKYPSNLGQDVSGHIQAVAPSGKGSELQITKGRIADIGQTLKLPLPDRVFRALRKSELEIDPSSIPGESVPKNLPVTESLSWDFPNGGAGAQVVSEEKFRYEGRFSCMVFPEGKCLLQRTGIKSAGGNPDIQKIIRKLKTSPYQALVKNFFEEGNDTVDSTQEPQKRYFWKLEGYYAVNTGSKLALK